MDWIAAIIGLSGMLFIMYSLPLIKKAADIWRLRENFIRLQAIPIREIKKHSGMCKIKGTASQDAAPLFSLFDDTRQLYYRTKIYPVSRKKFVKSWMSRKASNFKIKDSDGRTLFVNASTAESEHGRFIVFHRDIEYPLLKFCKKDMIPEKWRDNLENGAAIEEYLSEGKEVTVIGHFTYEKGRTALTVSAEKPFVIAECPDEVFLLLHLRFFSRMAFLSASMLLTGLIQLYMLFFIMLPAQRNF